jgi:hypothetical protein
MMRGEGAGSAGGKPAGLGKGLELKAADHRRGAMYAPYGPYFALVPELLLVSQSRVLRRRRTVRTRRRQQSNALLDDQHLAHRVDP